MLSKAEGLQAKRGMAHEVVTGMRLDLDVTAEDFELIKAALIAARDKCCEWPVDEHAYWNIQDAKRTYKKLDGLIEKVNEASKR